MLQIELFVSKLNGFNVKLPFYAHKAVKMQFVPSVGMDIEIEIGNKHIPHTVERVSWLEVEPGCVNVELAATSCTDEELQEAGWEVLHSVLVIGKP